MKLDAPAGACWIGSDHPFDLAETYLNFRRDLVLERRPAQAWLTITADSRYRLWVNGAPLASGPARSWPHAQQMDVIDIAPHLVVGRNALAVQVYSPGYSHFAYVHRGAVGLLAWAEADGVVLAVTDRSWRVSRDHSFDPVVPRVSIYGTGVERRDMARIRDWQVSPPGPAEEPRLVAPPDGPVWTGLRQRDVPMLTETQVALEVPWQFRRGRCPMPDDPHEAIRTGLADCPIGPAPDPGTAIRPDGGETAIWIFDLGSSRICAGLAEIDGALGGEVLTIGYAEKLRGGEVLISDPASYCRMRVADRFTLRPGAQLAEGFSLRGGRYLVFRLDAPKRVGLAIGFAARLTDYPLQERKAGPTGDATLDRVAAMCRRTILNCLQDGFVDSIWRESSQWLGDVLAEAHGLAAISDDARPLARAIRMAAEGAAADGMLPSVLPGEVHAYVITDYNFSWIEAVEFYQNHPGAGATEAMPPDMLPDMLPDMPPDMPPDMLPDMLPDMPPDMLPDTLAVMQKMLARFRDDLGADGLIRAQPGRRLFLDWSAVSRDEPSLTYNARYLHALQTAARLAARHRHDNPAHLWAAQATALGQSIEAQFGDAAGWRENPGGAPASQLGLALLILTGIITGSGAQDIADAIIARSLDLDDSAPPGKLILASPFMHHYIFLALDHLGRRADILAIIRARWGRWAEAGEPTTWENWNVDFPDGSVCHGFSAHPLFWLARAPR